MRLLVAEDDPRLLKSLVHILEVNKFVVDGVSTGDDALLYAQSKEYDGIILDIMMPGLDGIQVLKKIREENITTPTLFLTARTEVPQRIEGLNAGADDYLAKPFYNGELIARVRAMLRRKDNYTPDLIKYNGLVLNRSTYQMSFNDEIQILSGKEFQIIEMLMTNPNSIIQIEHFMTHIWGWNTEVDTSVVWVHVSNLRKKINRLKAPVEIKYLRSAGYILEAKQ